MNGLFHAFLVAVKFPPTLFSILRSCHGNIAGHNRQRPDYDVNAWQFGDSWSYGGLSPLSKRTYFAACNCVDIELADVE